MRATLAALPLLVLLACDEGAVVVDDGTDGPDDTDRGPNTPPTTPEVSISPADPGSDERLVANLVFEATDPDGDALEYRWAWVRDGAPVPEVTGPEVPNTLTARGETWEVRVRAFDGRDEGPTASDSVTIVNGAPKIRASWLDAAPTTDVDLVVDAEIRDPDDDPIVVTWAWTRDGAATPFDGDTVSADQTGIGELWRVVIRAEDPEGAADEVTLDVVVVNRPPVITNLVIMPYPAAPSLDLRAEATVTDDDGQIPARSYVWTRNGQPTAVVTSVVPNALTEDGDVWAVTLTASDDSGGITTAFATAEVRNTPPALTSIEIRPSDPGDGDDLVANVVASDPDGEPLTNSFTWYRNGVEFRTGTNARVVASSTAVNDVWEVAVTVTDGSATVGPLTSAPVTVRNRPPTDPVVALVPAVPDPCTELLCRVTASSNDPDGTAVTYTVSWRRNGSLYTGSRSTTTYTNDTVPASALAPGDTWTCEVYASSGGQVSGTATDAGTVPADGTVTETFPIVPKAQTDLLLVVDDSCSMSALQTRLANAATPLVNELLATGTSFQIGVVTTDMEDVTKQGRLQGGLSPKYVSNTTPNPATALSSIIQVGTSGYFEERGLDAFREAVTTHASGANAGFLRTGSAFGLLILSDEEDWGTSPISEYVTLFQGLRTAGNRTLHAIVGPEPSGCNTGATSAFAGSRYLGVVDAVGGQSTSICASQGAFDAALTAFAGAAAGKPKVLVLDGVPDATPTVTSIAANGTRTVLTSPSGFTWTAGTPVVTLTNRPSVGSIEVRYELACPTDAGGDTAVDTDITWP